MRFRTLRGGAVTLLVLLAAFFLGAEAALRLSCFGLSSAALGRWQQRAGWEAIRTLDHGGPWPLPGGSARWALQAGSPEIDYRLDSDGFRVAAGEPASHRVSCRVLALGDSNVFGYGVRAEEAFPAKLEGILRAQGVEVEVRNAGFCGSDVAQQRRWLESVLERAAPDVVVFAVSPWSLRTDQPPKPRTTGEKLWNVVNRRSAALTSWSAVMDRTRRRLLHSAAALVGWPPPSNVAWELQPLLEPRPLFDLRFAAAATEIRRATARLRAAEASPLLVLVPLDVQTDRARNHLYVAERLPYASWGFVDVDYTRDGRYGESMAHLARELGVPLLDVTTALANEAAEGYLQDDYHLHAVGHRRIAEEIASAVRDACDRIVVASGPVHGDSRRRRQE
jgi:lysophospholipase L1-like esterase